jgi:lipooligosaccharide transport system ATP-binding protein
MDKAAIVAEGSPRDLIARYSTREVLELRFPDEIRTSLDGRLSALGERVEFLSDRVQVYTGDGEAALQQVHTLGIPLESALVRRSTLEDVFLRITGRGLIE